MIDVFNWDRFRGLPLVGIIRRAGPLDHRGFVEAVIAGGINTIEFSFTFPDAGDHIAALRSASAGRLNVGAGTVTTMSRLSDARRAGASFVVTPGIVPEVIAECRNASLPVFCGAFTPTEIISATSLGAAMVKLFPAISLGPTFVAQFKTVMPEIPLLPTGGISAADIPAWRHAGADGLGLGGGLFPSVLLERQAWSELSQHIRHYVNAWNAP